MTKELLDIILSKQVIGPILVIACSVLLYGIVKRIVKKMLHINFVGTDIRKNQTASGLICNVVKYLLIVIDILIILGIYGVDTKGIIASLGVVGVVVGLAVQDTLKDFFSGIFILSEDQYRVGDTVQIGDFKGEVIYLGLKTTRVKAYTGEILIVSNRNIPEVINYSKADSLAIVDITTSYEEDTTKIENTLQKLCNRLSKELPDLTGKIELLGITNFNGNGVDFRLTASTKPTMQYGVERMIRKAIKDEFLKQNIHISYQQMVIHHE